MRAVLVHSVVGLLLAGSLAAAAPQSFYSSVSLAAYATIAALQSEITRATTAENAESVRARAAEAAIVTNFVGKFTVATLPACDDVATKYGSVALVSDLGGGSNTARCVAGAWQHFSLGVPKNVTVTSGTVPITPLSSAPIQIISGAIPAGASVTVQLQAQNLYPGYTLYVIRPSALLGAIGVSVQGVQSLSLPVLGNSRNAFIWDGTTLQQIQ